MVGLLLPGSTSADEWLLVLARKKRHMWPVQVTAQLAAMDLPTAKYTQKMMSSLSGAVGLLIGFVSAMSCVFFSVVAELAPGIVGLRGSEC